MLYFDTLPKVLTPDKDGNALLLTNIMSRAALIEEMQNNPMLFYTYSVQDGDTPEIVAEKYYGDPFRYWVVLYSNQLLDPLWDWPLKYSDFNAYIISKYGSELTAKNTVHHYEKIVTQTDNTSGNVTTITNIVTEDTYNSIDVGVQLVQLPNGESCTVSTDRRIVDNYTYEDELNESKRNIKIMDARYVSELEQQFKSLMKVKK